jgi:hypothetical protein
MYQLNTKHLKLLLFVQLLCTGVVMVLLLLEQRFVANLAISGEQIATFLLSIACGGLLLRSSNQQYLRPCLISLNLLGMTCTFIVLACILCYG